MNFKKITATFFAFAFLAFLSTDAFACACCSEPGTYYLSTVKPAAYEISLLEEMKFDRAAYLFMTEAGFDSIKGLESIRKTYESDSSWVAAPDYFSLTGAFAARTWKFNFKTKDGKAGALALPMPVQMVQYKADTHEGKTSGGGGPMLYKEWRFKGNVQSGGGFFQAGIAKPTTYFLVLQGRGNGCDNAEDFTHWRLEIEGARARYAFFGKLSSGNSSSADVEQDQEKN